VRDSWEPRVPSEAPGPSGQAGTSRWGRHKTVSIEREQAESQVESPVKSERPSAASMVESIVGCKWSLAVLRAVRQGVHRPGQLERHCAGISTKVLGERLRKLVSFDLLERTSFGEVPPRVEYRFTTLGQRFLVLLDEVDRLQSELDGGGSGSASAEA